MNEIVSEDKRKLKSLCSLIPVCGYFIIAWLSVVALCSCFVGCKRSGAEAPPGDLQKRSETPKWVLSGRAPEIRSAICAVGFAGPAYFRKDGIEMASEKARVELALTMEVKIQKSVLDIQRNSGNGTRDSQSIMEVTASFNDLILEGSKIVEIWYDEEGKGFGRRPRSTYALACIDLASIPRSAPGK